MPLRAFHLASFAVLCLLSGACGKRQTIEVDAGLEAQYAYFPLETGRYVTYAVDSIVYDFVSGGTARDSVRRYVREVVGDTLRDNTGQLLYAIERYERSAGNESWQLTRIWSAARTASQAIRTEDNLRFLKLVFPMNRRSEWDGNLWIDKYREIEIAGERIRPFTNWNYEVDSIDMPGGAGAFQFDSMLVVTEADDLNIIERRFSRAKYAKHVGLVWREQWILDSQYCNQNPPPGDCETKPWQEKAEKGYILRQTVVEFR